MSIPYTGPALKTYEKIICYPHIIYKVYRFKDNVYFYVNQKGYMHFIMIDHVKYNGKLQYYVSFLRLTKDNLLHETGQDPHYYSTVDLAIERLNEIISYLEEAN